jgi:hypothetical protein
MDQEQTYSYRLSFASHCRLLVDQLRLRKWLILLPLLPLLILLVIGRHLPIAVLGTLLTISLGAGLAGGALWLVAMVALIRVTSRAFRDPLSLSISSKGLRLLMGPTETSIPWEAIQETRIHGSTLFVRTWIWQGIPVGAFGPIAEAYRVRDLIDAHRGSSATTAIAVTRVPHAYAPPGRVEAQQLNLQPPVRAPETVVRVTSYLTLGALLNRSFLNWRYHPFLSLLPALVMVAPIAAILRGPNLFLFPVLALTTATVMSVATGLWQRSALRGAPVVMDFDAAGLRFWSAQGSFATPWKEIAAAETRRSLVFIGRMFTLPVSRAEISAADFSALRELVAKELGTRARLKTSREPG